MKAFFVKLWNTIKTAFQTKAYLKWVSLAVALLITGGIVLGVGSCNASPNDPGTSSNSSSSASSSSSSGDGEEEILNYMYLVKVQTVDGYGLSGVKVHLYDGDTEVTSLNTNSAGEAKFQENILPQLGTYTVKLTDLPVGYKLQDESAVYQTAPIKGMKVAIPLMPTGVIKENAPKGKKYKLGDVMYDFSLTLSDGTTTTLSKILEEKDMVFLNFWALRCAPCKQEFPYMNMTYISWYNEEENLKYSDKIAILAINNEDSQSNIDAYKNGDAALQFEMLNDYTSNANVSQYFNLNAIPVSALIDRYGVVASLHTGSLSNVSQFKALFDPYIGEDYTPTIMREDTVLPGEDDEESNRITPTVSNPQESDIQAALKNNAFTYSWDKGEYSWPWLIGEEDGDSYIYSSNKGVDNSYAVLYANFTAEANKALCFDLRMETELFGNGLTGDFFYVFIDGALVQSKLGRAWQWETFCAYVFKDFEAGEHELAIYYMKDGTNSSGEDVVQIKNIRFESVDALNGSQEVDSYVIRQAATVKNTDEKATTQYQNYVNVVLNETDGYYHVNTKDGPVLYANVLGSTLFSDYTIYDLALGGYSISDGVSLRDEISGMAWEANYNYINHGYTPVTEQWKNLLIDFVACTTYTQKWSGKTHDKEWLELCVYYDHYGDTPVHADPMLGITCNAALPIGVGVTDVSVPFEMNPRGFKYKFVPTQSGVYNVRSLGDGDTICFLADETFANKTITGIYEDDSSEYLLGEFFSTLHSKDDNFNFHYYFEEGKTYYMLLAYYDSSVYGSYQVQIDYVSATYEYLEYAGTTISFSTTEDGVFYVLDGVEYAKSEADGYYHVKNADGTLGSILYVDTAKATYFSGGVWSLKDAADGKVDGFNLVIDDVDYTEQLKALCQKGAANTEMPGFVAIDQEVFKLLNALTSNQDQAVKDEWLLMCYYIKSLG